MEYREKGWFFQISFPDSDNVWPLGLTSDLEAVPKQPP
jgi:hypothetical protein